jgi:CheY-like chemotaxis protein
MSIDNQRAVSELLRSADKSIKEGNLDSALAAISKVFEFDQRNVYARAYQERILSLKEMQIAARANAEKIPPDSAKKVQESDFAQPKYVPPVAKEIPQTKVEPPTAAPQQRPKVFVPMPEPPVREAPPVQAEPKLPEPKQAEPLPPEPKHSEQPVAEPPVQPTVQPAVQPVLRNETPLPLVDTEQPGTPAVQTPEPETLTPVIVSQGQETASPAHGGVHLFDGIVHTPARLAAYKTLLAELWTADTFSESAAQRVAAIKESFSITEEEHSAIERDIRFSAYLASIEQAWKKGVTSFDEMRKQFRISDQEHLQIEGRVFRLLQSLRSVGTVLLIDDDPEFLRLASRQLTEGGYYCVTVATCEEALFVLESLTPNVVVCDVNFTKPNMSGFAFYEKFRAVDKFFNTPFIFLSGMVQEAVQRTGMQMGADSYFTKPIDLELFLATIEGKIKRSYELQQRLSPHRL